MLKHADIRVAMRGFRRRPGMVGAILLTLALGIGVNTAMLTLIEAVVLRPIVATEPDRLVAIYTPTRQTAFGASTLALQEALAMRASSLAGVAAYWSTTLQLTSGSDTRDLDATFVSDGYFTLLGTRAAIGRMLSPGDSLNRAPTVVVLSDAFWRSNFGADPAIIGTNVVLRGQPFTVIGVAQRDFHGTNLTNIPDVWLPISALPLLKFDLLVRDGRVHPGMPVFSLLGRLASRVDRVRAEMEVERVARDVALETDLIATSSIRSSTDRPYASVLSLRDAASPLRERGTLFRFLITISTVAAFTLLLACMNVGNLLLIRGRERAKELGIRKALGANTHHVVQQVLLECILLSLGGGIVGVGITAITVRVLRGFRLPGNIAIEPLHLRVNGPMLLFGAGLSIIAALVFGLQPAIRAARVDVLDALNDRQPRKRRYPRVGMLPLQVALSLTALINAALLLRSIRAGVDTNIGFDSKGIGAVTLAYEANGKYAESVERYSAIVNQLRRTPGIVDAAAATHVPLANYGSRPVGIGPAEEVNSGARQVMAGVNHVSAGYFRVLGVPVIQGRGFGDQDRAGAPRAMILNESAARDLFPGEPVIGKLVHAPWFGPIQFTYVVVGVVRDTKYGALQDQGMPFAFVSLAQEEAAGASVTIIARGQQSPALLETIRRTIRDVAPDRRAARSGSSTQPGPPARFLADQIIALLAPQRFGATLLVGFAILALCVSAVGIYGNVAYIVSRRTKDIGIRMALGAGALDVVREVVGDAGVALIIGSGIGLVGAALASKVIEQFLYGVAVTDPVAIGAALTTIVLAAILASLVPALRAVRIDPAKAIRTLQ